ncbi:hypothetical protein CAEBREN_03848 [Caenorhabditis brenneri]|uniref:Uncharacterized protein n=1 Tax=Caenorhabditis brenneri TaxID=135651 RepID=G0NTP3_CAEBE|nr:hypothetical protein CAEBREN_03848 [Caenorhabditis brenneri]
MHLNALEYRLREPPVRRAYDPNRDGNPDCFLLDEKEPRVAAPPATQNQAKKRN